MPVACQRWRLVVARSVDAPPLAQRESADAWQEAMEATGLPLYRTAASTRPKIAFGAPLAMGIAAEAELLDVVLTERWPIWRVRGALVDGLPAGWRLVDLYDVWLAGPPLPGRVAAADYRIVLGTELDGAARAGLEAAVATFLASKRSLRERVKGGGTVAYDLRPLVLDVREGGEPPRTEVWTRTRFHPELGTGRPEEVIAALGDLLGQPLAIESIVRERVVLSDELD
jgi:hypothetical protein